MNRMDCNSKKQLFDIQIEEMLWWKYTVTITSLRLWLEIDLDFIEINISVDNNLWTN